MNILVTGGAGYIGSHASLYLKEKGFNPIIIDNFSRSSHNYARKYLSNYTLIEGCIGNSEKIKDILTQYRIEGIIHFAAYAYVAESVKNPTMYYRNNVSESIAFLESVNSFYNNTKSKQPPIIFSSTCSVYGETEDRLISENTKTNPLNPYAKTKIIVEDILSELHKVEGMSSISFRYFNAAGADAELRAGENHQPETHLIPLLIDSAINEEKKEFSIYGKDYPTNDGTCIRDYTHVSDIANAHILGLERLLNIDHHCNEVINLGSGTGSSNLEVLQVVEEVTGCKINYTFADRRKGDAASLIANNQRARDKLGWEPKQSNLKEIIKNAHAWQVRRRYI